MYQECVHTCTTHEQYQYCEPMPNRVKLATQEVFADANPILAWSMEGDCPWETTDDSDEWIVHYMTQQEHDSTLRKLN